MAARRGVGRARGGGRTAGIDEVYERDDAARDARMEEGFAELRAMFGNIVQRMDALEITDPTRRRPVRPNPQEEEGFSDDEGSNPFAGHYHQRGRDREIVARTHDSHSWEKSLKIDLPEFQGNLSPEEFLDWLNAIDEIMDFKGVPVDRRVPLVATRFRGRASAWWQQLKISRSRNGKSKITDWEKLKKKMRVEFLPITIPVSCTRNCRIFARTSVLSMITPKSSINLWPEMI